MIPEKREAGRSLMVQRRSKTLLAIAKSVITQTYEEVALLNFVFQLFHLPQPSPGAGQ
jgi:hypothetical protein